MAEIELRPWDPVEHLRSHEDCISYFDVALEEDDPTLVYEVLGDIARFKGMNEVAEAIGDNRGRIFEAASEEHVAQLGIFLKALRDLGLSLYAGPRRVATEASLESAAASVPVDAQEVAD